MIFKSLFNLAHQRLPDALDTLQLLWFQGIGLQGKLLGGLNMNIEMKSWTELGDVLGDSSETDSIVAIVRIDLAILRATEETWDCRIARWKRMTG